MGIYLLERERGSRPNGKRVIMNDFFYDITAADGREMVVGGTSIMDAIATAERAYRVAVVAAALVTPHPFPWMAGE